LTFTTLPFILIPQNPKGRSVNTMRLKTSFFKTFVSLFLIVALTALINSPTCRAAMRTVIGTVTKVSDGDSIQITTPEQTMLKVRLYGIDAPETPKINHRTGQVNKPGQPHGEESWKALENKIMGKQVKMDILDIDKYRRMVGIIWLDDRNINLEMVREGYAEAFIEYLKTPYRSEFLEAEHEARSAKRGIWSLPDYERPRVFRKRLKISGGE
jgi:micrococcal nuclease